MLEAVGHEFMEEFFGCCESALADDGLLVLQVLDRMFIKLLSFFYTGMYRYDFYVISRL